MLICRVLWYTAMLGKKSSVKVIVQILLREGFKRSQIFTSTFAQGTTYRWGIAWTWSIAAAEQYKLRQWYSKSLDRVQSITVSFYTQHSTVCYTPYQLCIA